jgi:hypothetical protein
MPDIYKEGPDDFVCAYIEYYFFEKNTLLQYKIRPEPEWIVKTRGYFEKEFDTKFCL